MIRRLIILDSALIVLLAFGAVKFRRDWLAFEPMHQVSAIQPKPEKLPTLPAARAAAAAGAADWTEIPAHNPFSFDRNDIAVLAQPEPPKPVGPKPLLFGTMNLGQGWIAMLASGQANNRNSRPARVGETIDGWTVVEISDKAVVLEANANREKVTMDDITTVQIPRSSEKTGGNASPVAVTPISAAPSVTAASRPGASLPPSSGNAAPANGKPCVREIQTPFGVVRQPCEDSAR